MIFFERLISNGFKKYVLVVKFYKIFKILLKDLGLKFVKDKLLNGLLKVMILVLFFLFLLISLVCVFLILLLKYDLKLFVNLKLYV